MGLSLGETLGAILPHLTAVLNALAGILIVIGYSLIKSQRRDLHRKVMTSAVIVSALFLVAYVLHHLTAPVYVFGGQGIVRPIYFVMLTTHVVLAVAVTPMVILTFMRALRARRNGGITTGDFSRHKALARWTLPIWLYVSVTGVLVYLMVYQIYPAGG